MPSELITKALSKLNIFYFILLLDGSLVHKPVLYPFKVFWLYFFIRMAVCPCRLTVKILMMPGSYCFGNWNSVYCGPKINRESKHVLPGWHHSVSSNKSSADQTIKSGICTMPTSQIGTKNPQIIRNKYMQIVLIEKTAFE